MNVSERVKNIDDEMLEKMLSSLDDVVKAQCAEGNWDHDEYMHGMANGLILAQSLFSAGLPVYLDPPDVWGKDKANTDQPTSQDGICASEHFKKDYNYKLTTL